MGIRLSPAEAALYGNPLSDDKRRAQFIDACKRTMAACQAAQAALRQLQDEVGYADEAARAAHDIAMRGGI